MNGIQGLSHLGDSNILGVVFVQLFCGKKILGGELTSLQNYFRVKNRVCCASNLLVFCELPAASLGSSEVFIGFLNGPGLGARTTFVRNGLGCETNIQFKKHVKK